MTKELPVPLQWQIISFLHMTWPEGFVDEPQRQAWLAHQEHHPRHFILVDGGALISHAAVLWKRLRHAGQSYKAYGLSGVFTCPAWRGRGYGRRLVEAATAYIRQSDGDIGLLWCAPYLEQFYARCGWEGLENAVTLVGPTAAPVVYHLLLMMLFLSPRGQQGRPAFAGQPIYFGLAAW